jgi:hypothetical protein
MEAAREVKMRKAVWSPDYPAGRGMTPIQQKRADIMQEIADEYQALAEKEHLL